MKISIWQYEKMRDKVKTKENLKPLNNIMQVCSVCGKVDIDKNNSHSCMAEAQKQMNDDYYWD